MTFITVVPLVAAGLALRSSRRGVARTTAVMALIVAALRSLSIVIPPCAPCVVIVTRRYLEETDAEGL